ncbi:RloB domain-containing protein [Sphaerochaeta sp. PS]|uniref:RloB domain-containing protein n=1 Tax=Sphaerochaeta sp. PS TaxID=3076336 RepID=UPI003917FAFE
MPFRFAKQAIEQSDHYCSSIDTLYIIVDCDMHGFRDYQYDMLRQKCVEAGYFLAISNPCFEVWLLFRYSDLTEYDHQMILAHKKLANVPKQRYTSKIS